MADIGLLGQVAAAPDLSVGPDAAEFDIWLQEQFPAAPDLACFPTQWGIRPAIIEAAGNTDLAGAAIAGALAEGVLDIGVGLAGDAVAGADADGALEIGIELAGAAIAGADGDAALTVDGGEEPPQQGGGWVTAPGPKRRRPRWKQAEDAIAAMVAIH